MTISGTAVKGAALAGAAVSVKCAAGTANTTTAASGAYTATITSGATPCVVRVVGTDGTTYHSLVGGQAFSGTFVANVTPLTEMVVASSTGILPTTLFSEFRSTAEIPDTYIALANAYVQTAMAGLTDLSGINVVTDSLVVGDAQDKKIEAVVAGLAAAGVTLDQVTATIVANPVAPSVVAAPLASAASSCAWFKSGTYRVIDRLETDPKYRFQTARLSATALTLTDVDNNVIPLTSDGACQFSANDADATYTLMAASGDMFIVHAQSKTVAPNRAFFVGVPEQTLPVSEFAGTWNVASWFVDAIGVAGEAVASIGEVTIDATGQLTAMKSCLGLATCNSGTGPFPKLVVNAAGGFDAIANGASVARVFVYKTLAGKKVMVLLDGANNLQIAAPKETVGALPAVGTATGFRYFQINNNNSISAWGEDTNTVTAVDSAARTVTRLRTSNNRLDMLTYDKPRDGLRYRAPNSCTINGVASNCAEIVQLPLQGMGIVLSLTAVVNPSTAAFYEFSIIKP